MCVKLFGVWLDLLCTLYHFVLPRVLHLCAASLPRMKMHEERKTTKKSDDVVPKGAVPAYLLDR